jgi:propanol-preferring alcohol dehydrogenase
MNQQKALTGNEIPPEMRAMRIHLTGPMDGRAAPLSADRVETPRPGPGELLLRVHACGVCHTEIDEIEGRTPPPRLPMTPGHQVVGTVVAEGPECSLGLHRKRVGVAWIHSACGSCEWCLEGRENLCPGFRACGRDAPGGYAEYMTVPEAFAHRIPDRIGDLEATPLLCAGAVGYRALHLCQLQNGQLLGLTGFGASGHLVLQMARHLYPDSPIHVFARAGAEREFALSLGATWAGATTDQPPALLQAIIDTTPAWLPVLAGMEALAPGGRLVINAIRKEAGDRGNSAAAARHALRVGGGQPGSCGAEAGRDPRREGPAHPLADPRPAAEHGGGECPQHHAAQCDDKTQRRRNLQQGVVEIVARLEIHDV